MDNSKTNLSGQVLDVSSALVADSPIAIAIQYLGTLASATYTVASGDITLKHGVAAAEAVDATVGASGVVADGTYTTLGAMVDAINASPNWHAEIVDGLRADVSTAALKAKTETTFTRNQVVGLFADTSASLSLSFRISARRDNFSRDQLHKRSVFKRANALVNVGSGTLTLSVLDVTADGVLFATRATFAGTDNTALDTGLNGPSYKSEYGHDLLVRYVMSVDLPDTGAYLNVSGEVET